MKRTRVLWLALLMALCCVGMALAETEERIIPKYEEMVVPVGKTLLTRFSTTTGPMKKAGVTYEISDESIATVNSAGYVRGVAPGECTLTLTSRRNPAITATIRVRIILELKKIKLSAPSRTMLAGRSMQLEYGTVPEGMNDVEIRFSSNKETVATVDQNGLVTAHARGSATITARSGDGKVKASVRIKVKQGVEAIGFATDDVMISVGKRERLKAAVTPSNADNRKLVWSSADETIATVDKSGRVTAHRPGNVKITAASAEDESVYGVATVHCVKPAESVHFEQTRYDVQAGETIQLHPIVLPEDTTLKTVAYHVQNRNICAVDANGVVTPLRTGETVVRVVTADGSERETFITVRTVIPPEGLTFVQKGCRAGVEGKTFAYLRVEPSGAGGVTDIRWESSNPAVAAVYGTGTRARIEGHRWGRCVVTGSTMDGKFSAGIQVNVGALHEAVSIQNAAFADGSLHVTLHNSSDMHMTGVNLRVSADGAEQNLGIQGVDLAAGATEEYTVAYTGGKRGEVAVLGWQTDGCYYNNQEAQRDSYRIAPGMMTWCSFH